MRRRSFITFFVAAEVLALLRGGLFMPTIRAYASTEFLFAVSWLLTAGFAALRWYVGWDTCFGEDQCIENGLRDVGIQCVL